MFYECGVFQFQVNRITSCFPGHAEKSLNWLSFLFSALGCLQKKKNKNTEIFHFLKGKQCFECIRNCSNRRRKKTKRKVHFLCPLFVLQTFLASSASRFPSHELSSVLSLARLFSQNLQMLLKLRVIRLCSTWEKPDTDWMFLLEDYQILLTVVHLSNSLGSSAVLVMKHLIPKLMQSCTLARSSSLTTLGIGHVCDV